MWLKPWIRRTSFALAFAITGCTVSSTSDTCSSDSTVARCTQGSTGFSCTGAATPDQTNSAWLCSKGTPDGSGSTLFCCVNFGPATSVTTCKPDLTVSNCPGTAQGYSCTGVESPDQSDGSLSCGPGTSGSGGSTSYCCTTGGANGQGADAGSDASAEATIGAEAATAEEAANEAASDAGSDVPNQDETGADAAPEGGICAVTADTGNATCDQCVNSACCAPLVACGTADAAGSDDAGASACEQLLQCTLDCVLGNPDAGQPPGTLAGCQDLCNPSYTMSEQANASALISCLTSSCFQACQ